MILLLIIPFICVPLAIVYATIVFAVKGGTKAQRITIAGVAALYIGLIVFTLVSIEGTSCMEYAIWIGLGVLIWLCLVGLMNRWWKLLAARCVGLLLLVGARWGYTAYEAYKKSVAVPAEIDYRGYLPTQERFACAGSMSA